MERKGGKDNCTAWPDRIAKINLSEACYIHDENYGPDTSISRWEADKQLFLDVGKEGKGLKKLLSWPIAAWMWLGVRIGGRNRYKKNKEN